MRLSAFSSWPGKSICTHLIRSFRDNINGQEIKSTNLNHNQSPMKKLNHSKNSHKDNSKSDSEFDEDSIEDEHEKE